MDKEDNKDTKDNGDIDKTKSLNENILEHREQSKEKIELWILILEGRFGGMFTSPKRANKRIDIYRKGHKDCEYNISPITLTTSYGELKKSYVVAKKKLIGEPSKEECPQCHAPLLINSKGHLWCSEPGCAFGLWLGFNVIQWASVMGGQNYVENCPLSFGKFFLRVELVNKCGDFQILINNELFLYYDGDQEIWAYPERNYLKPLKEVMGHYKPKNIEEEYWVNFLRKRGYDIKKTIHTGKKEAYADYPPWFDKDQSCDKCGISKRMIEKTVRIRLLEENKPPRINENKERPDWCPHSDCTFINCFDNCFCKGKMSEPVIHDGTTDDLWLCMKPFDSDIIDDFNMNKSDFWSLSQFLQPKEKGPRVGE